MTRYTVIWDESVEADFLDAWIKSDAMARAALTEVASTIDRTLSINANTAGQKQPDDITRVVIVQVGTAAITVFFEVTPDDYRVLIRRLVFRHRMDSR